MVCDESPKLHQNPIESENEIKNFIENDNAEQ